LASERIDSAWTEKVYPDLVVPSTMVCSVSESFV
jgi:hypothetical protein